MAKNQNLLITAALAVVIIIAIGVFAYTNLFNPNETIDDSTNDTNPDESSGTGDNEQNNTNGEILLTIQHGGMNYTYSLSELEEIESVNGKGRKINSIGEISDPYNYTGISINALTERFDLSSDQFEIKVIANDGYSRNYTLNELDIEVTVYNEDGNLSANQSVTMIIAYMEDNQYYTGSNPLRIAFIGENTPITSSSLWVKNITTLEIKEIQ